MITIDSQALLLLCSHLGLPLHREFDPLTLHEWNAFASALIKANLRPGAILDWNSSDFQSRLMISSDLAIRLAKLLGRSGILSIELERLESIGIHALTRADDDYPDRYRKRLKSSSPTVLFYAGEKALLGQPGIAIVGSRHLDEADQECAQFVGNACGISGQVLYTGGAKGVDTLSMDSALEARGTAVGVLADSLEKAIRNHLEYLQRGDLCLITPYNPNAGFTVGAAMGRNRLIYCLADFAIVVTSDAEKGGTWAGAIETLKNKWVPVFVLEHEKMSTGNKLLLRKGAMPFPHPFNDLPVRLPDWLKERASKLRFCPEQPTLF
jgi:predicted Rossmann fold nucleotide-binding protein DprA/Smf involved in DNA uptake